MSEHVIIVGAGHGGAAVAGFLRHNKFDGSITLIGEEPLLPYNRPPLSKAWLKGEADGHTLAIRPPKYYAEHKIQTLLSTKVSRIDREQHEVILHDGRNLYYDHLILATGSRARPIPVAGAESHGIMALRNAADADMLKEALKPGMRLAVVGGGYIGLEAAASARALGADVTVIEREKRVLARVASPPLSAFFTDLHTRHGVAIELGADVDAFESHGNHVTGVLLRDGRSLKCDAALVGIGAIPNDELARESGLDCEVGIVVDLDARTSDPAIYAIGDATFRPMPLYDRMARLESVPNALEQARRAAAKITGAATPPTEVPWFWSDQYDVKLQIAGVAFDSDRLVVRGDPSSGHFAVFHLRGERVLAVEAVNAVPEFMSGKKMIGALAPVSPEQLADLSVPMKQLAA